ncbi:MAG: NAD(P)-dependent dehydrogenase (short-subunit alcohol dehydrogenase family) [Oleiphilaceae bacterium]|jgi:NAD(P)-dependent dehydrogenase (short-subunit alcohol dehydrogenase family)
MNNIVLITGANRGIGLELSRLYTSQNDQVIAVCRETSDEIENMADLVISGIDLTHDEAMDTVLQVLKMAHNDDFKIDILINNAGLFQNETLDAMNYDQIRQQFEVNALAPLKVTHALLPHLKSGSKIANITSRMGSLEDNTSGAYYGYRASKAALNAFGKSLAMDLKPKGIAVAQLHPGFVQTRMVGFNGDLSPEQAANGLCQRIDELNIDNSGGFWHSNGEVLPW